MKRFMLGKIRQRSLTGFVWLAAMLAGIGVYAYLALSAHDTFAICALTFFGALGWAAAFFWERLTRSSLALSEEILDMNRRLYLSEDVLWKNLFSAITKLHVYSSEEADEILEQIKDSYAVASEHLP